MSYLPREICRYNGFDAAKSVGSPLLFVHENSVYGRDVRRWIHVPRDGLEMSRARCLEPSSAASYV